MVIFGMGVVEPLFRDVFIPKFEKESGCKVTFVGGGIPAILARIKAEAGKPTVDVVNMQRSEIIEAKRLGLLERNNRDVLTNLKFVHPKLLDPDDIGAPFLLTGGAIISVRHDKLKEKNLPMPESWLDLANPAYKGKVGILDIDTATSRSFIALIARALGGNEVNDYARAFDWMDTKLKPNLLAVAALAQWQKLLEEGSIWVGMSNWGRPARVIAAGFPVTLVWSKEGNDYDVVFFVAVRGASNPVCAQLWMNYAMSKEVQEIMPEALLYGPTRTDVVLSEKVKGLVFTPDDMKKAVELDRDAIAKNSADWVERWTRVFAK